MNFFYIYIILLGVCAFCAQRADVEFKGSSKNVKMVLTIGAGVGYMSFISLFIAAFFFIPWWHVLLLFLVITPTAASFIQWLVCINPIAKVVVGFISCIGIVVFSVLTWDAMI